MKPFFIANAIDYPNGNPHIGHAYERVISDFIARWHRQKGEEVFFSIGTDEHGQKVQQAAIERNLKPQEWVDTQAEVFKDLAKQLHISNDIFIRTTDEKHKKKVQEQFQKAIDKGDVYKGEYKGNYCVKCEAFFTDFQAKEGKCPECQTKTKVLTEEAYFFKLSKYQKPLIDHIEKNKDFILPETRRNEILSRLKNDDLQDLCISRSTFDWGVPLPNDPNHVMYVWFDALYNYYTLPPKGTWPCDIQVIGKDIIWFHTVYWPAFLLSADLPLPKHVYAHGFILDKNGEAMSKSKGNVIDPIEMLRKYGVDAFRFYVARAIPSGDDGSFSEEDLVAKYNNELGNDLGNVVRRVQVLVHKYFDGKLEPQEVDEQLFKEDVFPLVDAEMQYFNYQKAIDHIWKFVRSINAYLTEKEPWKNEENREQVLYTVLEALNLVTQYLYPFIPESAEKIADALGFSRENVTALLLGKQAYDVKDPVIIFPKIEEEKKPVFPLQITVGKIIKAEKHPDADKLLVETIDFGNEQRTIVSGIAEHYKPEELIGKTILAVTNLKKAKLRGVVSEGMLLTAEKGDNWNVVEVEATPGTVVEIEGLETNTARITFDQFESIELMVKKKQILADDKPLLLNNKPIELEQEDGTVIR